jgi:hypothetical protein
MVSKLLPTLEKPKVFNLSLLQQQFGDARASSSGATDFVVHFLAALRETLTVFPQARVLVRPHGLVMLPLSSPLTLRSKSAHPRCSDATESFTATQWRRHEAR